MTQLWRPQHLLPLTRPGCAENLRRDAEVPMQTSGSSGGMTSSAEDEDLTIR